MSQPPALPLELSYLQSARKHVLAALDGLDDVTLRAPTLPSQWSPLGLVQHLTLEVERFWFEAVVAGDTETIALMQRTENAWLVPDNVPTAEVLGAYRAAAERADAIVLARSLDAVPAWWPEHLFGDWRVDNLKEVVLHVLLETASHAGQLDVVRELVDGNQYIVMR